MIDLLEDFTSICISKMMLNSFPSMIGSGSKIINRFFDSACYKPPLMAHKIAVDWPESYSEYIFPSSTSLITEESLKKEIESNTAMNSEIKLD